MKFLLLFLLAISMRYPVDGAKIFIHMGVLTSHSPTASIQPLADKLAEMGHQVTLYSPIMIPTRNPSIKMFCPDKMKAAYIKFTTEWGNRIATDRTKSQMNPETFRKMIVEAFDWSIDMCKDLLGEPELKELVQKEKYDLFIVDSGLNECGYPLAYHFRAKTIYYSALGTILPWDVELFGVPTELSWLPGFGSSFEGGQVSFLDRILNAVAIVLMNSVYRSYYLPKIEQLFQETAGYLNLEQMPPLENLVQNASLMLINQHFSDQFPRAYAPSVVQVGGLHVQNRNGTLPKEMEDFIGNDEFIFVSFGTFVRVSGMPQEVINTLYQVFGSTKLKFLWKWEGTVPTNAPSNILFLPWFPQQNLLGHPKIRGFITQGGQISIAQGVCHGVPLMIFPVDADQSYNAMRMRGTGNAIIMDLPGLTKPKLEDALNKILNDPIIASRAKRMEIACRDRPMSALDTAVWWTEWVLRTDDTSILKPLNQGQSLWYQWSLDVWSFFFILFLVITTVSLLILKFVLRKIFGCFFKKDAAQKKNKLKSQ